MLKIKSLLILLSLALVGGLAGAEGTTGYVANAATGTIIKTAYGECLHNSNWQPSDGVAECADAPTVTTVVEFSESRIQLFNFNKTTLSVAGKQDLVDLVKALKTKGPVKKIMVVGYTDLVGADIYNQRLSLERAVTVKNFLATQGLDGGIVTAEGRGAEDTKVSAGCFKKYGTADLDQLNDITAKDDTYTPSERKTMDAALASYSKSHAKLVACAAADRRVEITVMAVKPDAVE